MAYSNFTFDSVREMFALEAVQAIGIFAETEPVESSEYLAAGLAKKAPLAVAIGTEKARSEMIVTDVLVELWEHFERRISLFSGIDFNVDEEKGLVGVCDFVISLSPLQESLEAPIIILVEAKNVDVKQGIGQCVAEMLAAQRFNAKKGNDIPRVYGASTTGTEWRFLKLEGQTLYLDMGVYSIDRCDKLLGILASMVKQEA